LEAFQQPWTASSTLDFSCTYSGVSLRLAASTLLSGCAPMVDSIRSWLLKQLNADDMLDAVVLTVKLATREFGRKRVAQELRRMAESLEKTGDVRGWSFPRSA